MISISWDDVIRYCRKPIVDPDSRVPTPRQRNIEERFRDARNQYHFVIESDEYLKEVSKRLRACNAYLVTVVANDERSREDGCFKIYYIFSAASGDERLWQLRPTTAEEEALISLPTSDSDAVAADDQFLILEYLVQEGDNYPSLKGYFRSVLPFEREIRDLYCLNPRKFTLPDVTEERALEKFCSPVRAGAVLHGGGYPDDLAPLRADRQIQDLRERADNYADAKRIQKSDLAGSYAQEANRVIDSLGIGQLILPVGPIHKDVIEAGQFRMQIAGEPIDGIKVALGYKHKGIERLFTTMSLVDGWTLAEKVSGDSSFAHSLAYCQAVEELAGATIGARILAHRALFLELERAVNHVADTAALAHDIAFNVIASEIAVLRESLMCLNGRLLEDRPGSRLLRGINEPGGMRFTCELTTHAFNSAVRESTRGRFANLGELLEEFNGLSRLLLDSRVFMDRSQHVGRLLGPPRRSFDQVRQIAVLDTQDRGQGQDEVAAYGVTGLSARASGLRRDYRLRHPFGIYRWAVDHDQIGQLREFVEGALARRWPEGAQQPETEEMTGDVYSRTRNRVLEVEQSGKLIDKLLLLLDDSTALHRDDAPEDSRNEIAKRLSEVQPYEFALGYVEGWRGDIVYWLMKDRFDRIFRCKVRDPSMLNWQALEVAVSEPEHEEQSPTRRKHRPLVPDFPLINKSFNLSYAGYDL